MAEAEAEVADEEVADEEGQPVLLVESPDPLLTNSPSTPSGSVRVMRLRPHGLRQSPREGRYRTHGVAEESRAVTVPRATVPEAGAIPEEISVETAL